MIGTHEQKLLELVSQRFKTDASGLGLDEDIFERFGIDSLQALDLLSSVELEFGVTIPDSRLKEIKTLRNLVAVATRC
jgi:acyl carrier protein